MLFTLILVIGTMSSGFISEAELAEQRRIRQEEWEKVRKPGQPEECPEEEYDHRSLFERLEEQKQKRELEYEEAHRLKNMIKGLDDDEVEFLDLVDRSKLEEERRKSAEEAREMKDFREAVATLQERSLEQRIHTEIRSRPPTHSGTSSGRSSQVRLLAGAVVRKRPADCSAQDASNKKPCANIKVVIVYIVAVGFSLVTMDKNDVEEVPKALLEVASGNVRFTNSLYKAVAGKDGNVFISPISVEVVLALAYLGAAGNTAEQIASVLHLPADREDVKAGFLSLLGVLKSTENVTLELANKVFSQSGYRILPEYKTVAEKSFLSGAEELDFADSEGSRKVINSWIETKTNNKIRDMIPSGVLNHMTRLVLVNAVYFKGLWAKQFSADNTRFESFHLNSKESKEVPMMHKKAKFGYLNSEELDADILQMHYQGLSISMFIILPHDIDGISKLEKKLAGVDLSKILTHLPEQEVEVSIPKFKLEETTDLNDILTELGMKDMFIPHEADFSAISGKRDLFVSSVLQKAFVEVNEEGSEAAAATAAIMMTRMLLKQTVFHASHPFLFIIKEADNGVILFIGRFSKPSE